MGDEYETDGRQLINVFVEGAAPTERIDLLRGTAALCRWNIALPSKGTDVVICVLWGGTEKRGTARDQRVTWDGTLHVSGGRFLDAQPILRCRSDGEF